MWKLSDDIIGQMLRWKKLEQERQRELQIQAEAEIKRQAEEQRLREAAAMEKAGNKEEAQQHLDSPMEILPIIIPDSVPRLKNMHARKRWTFRIKCADKIKPEFLVPNEVAIRRAVTAMGRDAESVIGSGSVDIFEEETLVGRNRS